MEANYDLFGFPPSTRGFFAEPCTLPGVNEVNEDRLDSTHVAEQPFESSHTLEWQQGGTRVPAGEAARARRVEASKGNARLGVLVGPAGDGNETRRTGAHAWLGDARHKEGAGRRVSEDWRAGVEGSCRMP